MKFNVKVEWFQGHFHSIANYKPPDRKDPYLFALRGVRLPVFQYCREGKTHLLETSHSVRGSSVLEKFFFPDKNVWQKVFWDQWKRSN